MVRLPAAAVFDCANTADHGRIINAVNLSTPWRMRLGIEVRVESSCFNGMHQSFDFCRRRTFRRAVWKPDYRNAAGLDLDRLNIHPYSHTIAPTKPSNPSHGASAKSSATRPIGASFENATIKPALS